MRANPRESFAVRKEAGFAIKYTAPAQKHTAEVLGLTPSGMSRRVSGEISGTIGDFYEVVRAVVRDRRTGCGHIITGAMLVAQEEATKLPEPEIRARLKDAIAQESITEGNENVAQHRLALALGGDGDLRAALENYDAAVRHEQAAHIEALVYGRALAAKRGWR